MKVEMERHQLINCILACTAADQRASEGTKKWERLHDQLMQVLLDYDNDVEAAVNHKVSANRVYKLDKEVEV